MAFPSSLPADAGDYVDALVAAKKAKRSSSRQYNPGQFSFPFLFSSSFDSSLSFDSFKSRIPISLLKTNETSF
jgi:hypothetical protein